MKIEKYRDDLVDGFVKFYRNSTLDQRKDDLEQILWMLYNPTGVCEECGLDWDSLSCSCKGCEYRELDVINEPCDNHQFCVCDYFDGRPLSRDQILYFLTKLENNELTDLEKDLLEVRKLNLFYMLTLKNMFKKHDTFIIDSKNLTDMASSPDPFGFQKEIIKYDGEILSKDDKIRVIDLLFLTIEHYSSNHRENMIKIFNYIWYLFHNNENYDKYSIIYKTIAKNLLKYPDYLDDDDIIFLNLLIKWE